MPEEKKDRKTQIIIGIIGAIAVLLAAIIAIIPSIKKQYEVLIRSSDSKMGYIKFAGNKSNGKYEKGQYVEFTAIPNPGYMFLRWQNQDGTMSHLYGSTIKEEVNKDLFIDAIFKVSDKAKLSTDDLYLRGTFNNWAISDLYKFHFNDVKGQYELSIKFVAGNYEFKIGNPDWIIVNIGTKIIQQIEIGNRTEVSCRMVRNINDPIEKEKVREMGAPANLKININTSGTYVFEISFPNINDVEKVELLVVKK